MLTNDNERLKIQSQSSMFFVPGRSGIPPTLAFCLTFTLISVVSALHTETSPVLNWPVIGCLSFQSATIIYYPLYEFALATIFTLFTWFIYLIVEGLNGNHTLAMRKAFKLGFVLFLLSEVMFFFAIFWSYLYFYINPSIWVGGVWPPVAIETLNFLYLPLANTIILISSGFAVNWSHRWLVLGSRKPSLRALALTLFYGILFAWLQFLEYGLASYAINDSIYGSIFYFGTGFHGLHVIFGVLALAIAYFRITNNLITNHHHVGFWAAALYWHFVDVIWIFLYAIFYIWGTY